MQLESGSHDDTLASGLSCSWYVLPRLLQQAVMRADFRTHSNERSGGLVLPFSHEASL